MLPKVSRNVTFDVSGVTFDSREVRPGDLFIALRGEATDGHRFVGQAFESGASGAVVSAEVDGPCVLVADTFRALNDLGRAARARSGAKVIGVTGSVGKTGTKEALFAALERAAPGSAHRSVKSYNNHTGVPLSLARMPRERPLRRLRNGDEPQRRARRADPAGAASRRHRHRHRARPSRIFRQRRRHRRRQRRDFRRAGAGRHRDHPL